MDKDAFVFSQVPQHVGFDFVLVLLVKIAVVFARGEAPTSFDDLSLAEKIGALDGSSLVRCLEDHPVSEIQRQDSRLIHPKGRDERGGGLRRRDDRCFGFTHGRCETTTGIEPFDRLVQQVMEQEPYRNAPRVFWIVDNGSSHRGAASVRRLQGDYPNLILVHLPVHASWLNQVEIYFSVIQRKVLTPNDFSSLAQVAERILAFQLHYEQIAKPFEWKFTRADLHELMNKITRPTPATLAA
jgi:hypothetical protein